MTEKEILSTEIGSKLLFENDRVRVWDLHLAPGESTGLHAHHCDYFYVVIGDGELEARNPDGSVMHRGTMQDAEVHFRAIDGEPAVHEAFNVGRKPWRNIIVELKDKPAGPSPARIE
jgi:beta-alanine degradation protein BauB